jgi:hypothetical protein
MHNAQKTLGKVNQVSFNPHAWFKMSLSYSTIITSCQHKMLHSLESVLTVHALILYNEVRTYFNRSIPTITLHTLATRGRK